MTDSDSSSNQIQKQKIASQLIDFIKNPSEQTDISELFGADLPVEGESGKFAWHEGPLLFLDEMNLASQSVLEGLNSVLDHRGKVFISELSKEFEIDYQNKVMFACQNPYAFSTRKLMRGPKTTSVPGWKLTPITNKT